jgi:hypothetical protein
MGVIGEKLRVLLLGSNCQKAPNFFSPGKKTRIASQHKTQKKSSYEEVFFVPLSHASSYVHRSIDRIDFLNVSTR